LRAVGAAWRVGFAHVFVYRAEIAIQLISAAIVAGLNGSLWTAAVRGRDGIAGVPSSEMITYVVVAWVAVSFFASRVNEEIGRRVRDGQIATDLLHPTSLLTMAWARDFGRACACFLVHTLPLFAACAFVFPVEMPRHPWTWALWVLSLVLAHATNFGISFLVGLAALPLHSVTGLTHLKGTVVSVFSGALIPLELFGPALRPFLMALPFQALAYTPASIFLERDVSIVSLLGTQFAWAAVLWTAGALAWRGAARTLTVQGG